MDWFATEFKEAELGHEIEKQPVQPGGHITYMKFLDYPLKLIHKVYPLKLICVDHNKLWKVLKETGLPDHLTCLLRGLKGLPGGSPHNCLPQPGGKVNLSARPCHPRPGLV